MEIKKICQYCDKVALFLITGKSYCLMNGSEVNFNKKSCENFGENKIKMEAK